MRRIDRDLPAPHRHETPALPQRVELSIGGEPLEPSEHPVQSPTTVPDSLRALVGRRSDGTSVALAITAARSLGGRLSPALDALSTTDELLELAADKDAIAEDLALTGDLVVVADYAGIVVDIDERGVSEFVYLASGVVRRGFFDRSRPDLARDEAGRVVNSFVWHGAGMPPLDRSHLAGSELRAVIRLERLVR